MTEHRVPVLRGVGELDMWLAHRQPGEIHLLFDPVFTGTELLGDLQAVLDRAGRLATVSVVRDGGSSEEVRHTAARVGSGLVVGLGGGTTMDLAKLASVVAQHPEAWAMMSLSQRTGLVTLPERLGGSCGAVTIPTTVGTGSEVANVACFASPRGKKLVTGPCLRAAAAVREPRATQTLPSSLVMEGVLEALFRTTGPYVGDQRDLAGPDADVEQLAMRLVSAGDEVAEAIRLGHPLHSELRTRIADLSAASQFGDINEGRTPCSVRGWALGTELSQYTGLSKMQAIARLWPGTWTRILDGDPHWGCARRLEHLWRVVRAAHPSLDARPDRGIAALVERWLGTPTALELTGDDVDRLTAAAMRTWGAGIPVLGELRGQDVRGLYREVAAAGHTPTRLHDAATLLAS